MLLPHMQPLIQGIGWFLWLCTQDRVSWIASLLVEGLCSAVCYGILLGASHTVKVAEVVSIIKPRFHGTPKMLPFQIGRSKVDCNPKVTAEKSEQKDLLSCEL